MEDQIRESFEKLKDKWPSSVVARTSIKKFTGGLYSPGYLANEDSRGAGPEGAFTVGGKKAYPVESVIQWLVGRSSLSWSERKKSS